jgi:thiol-disulfide isomerase/thioredoxin
MEIHSYSYEGNNFSNDFATFLLGKGIPEHITNLPQTVLNTPFGRMIQPRIEQMVQEKREMNGGGLLGIDNAVNAVNTPKTHHQLVESVRKPNTSLELEKLLTEAEKSCAVIFFTSSNCRPCQTLYPVFDELAAEIGPRAVLILVDISKCYELGVKYEVRATPTFVSYLHGQKENRWTGADPSTLRGNVKVLVQMAWPAHPHEFLSLKTLRTSNKKPISYGNIPPLDKLKAKMGPVAEDPAIKGVMDFVSARTSQGAAEATLPNLNTFSKFLQSASSKLVSIIPIFWIL